MDQKVSRFFSVITLILFAGLLSNAQSFKSYKFGSHNGDPCDAAQSGIVAQGRDGNLYTTAPWCGAYGNGAVFKITPAGTLTVLHSFGENRQDPMNPYGGLTLGTDGNFYGTTAYGGTYGYGTVFRISSGGNLTILYNFTNGPDGAAPWAPPIEGIDGNLYGTTCGCYPSAGSIYKITRSGTFMTLHEFDFWDERYPYAPLVQGRDGNFYGTAVGGGPGGVIFKITPAGSFSVIYSFDDVQGGSPYAPLIQATDGNFYGTTCCYGNADGGVIFRMTPKGQVTIFHNMAGLDGFGPFAGLVQASDGNLYGANAGGGTGTNCPFGGCGTLYVVKPNGRLSTIYNFDYLNGANPYVTLLQHTNGIFYGDTWTGGLSLPQCTQSGGTCAVFYALDAKLPAFVSLVPNVRPVGRTVGILGQGFKNVSSVSFNGIPAGFTGVGDTFLNATVPQGATSGYVTVTTPSGTLTSNKPFIVLP